MSQAHPIAIVGAAGGIGKELGEFSRIKGHPLLVIGRQKDRLETFAATIPGSIQIQQADVDELMRIFKRPLKHTGQTIHGLVNLAGSIFLKPAQRTTEEDFQQVLNANLVTAFNCVAVAQGLMAKGSVVLMSSVAAQMGLMNHEAIAAAKAGVEGLARAASATGVRKGLRVNVVSPALTDTPLAAGFWAQTRLDRHQTACIHWAVSVNLEILPALSPCC